MAALHTCFSPVVCYQPYSRGIPPAMREWEQEGWLELRSPLQNEGVTTALREFRSWTGMQGGRDRAGFDYLRSHMDKVPFFDDSSVAQIQADIRGTSSAAGSASVSRFFNACVFLGIAQEMDSEAEALALDLQRHNNLERKLFSELTGAVASVPPPTRRETTGMHAHLDHMFRERLKAWWVLAASLVERAADEFSRIFISASRPVVDHLIDNSTGSVELVSMKKIPVAGSDSAVRDTWRRALLGRLRAVALADQPKDELAGIDWPAIPEENEPFSMMNLSIFLFPGMSPAALFHGATGRTGISVPDRSPAASSKNTLMVLIEV